MTIHQSTTLAAVPGGQTINVKSFEGSSIFIFFIASEAFAESFSRQIFNCLMPFIFFHLLIHLSLAEKFSSLSLNFWNCIALDFCRGPITGTFSSQFFASNHFLHSYFDSPTYHFLSCFDSNHRQSVHQLILIKQKPLFEPIRLYPTVL